MTNKEFDEKFRYDEKDLGVNCKEGKTVFKVWSPMAERILLRLYDKDGGEPFLEREMRLGERGYGSGCSRRASTGCIMTIW